MKSKKGLELPISIIVVIAVAVLVLAVVAAFFLTTGVGQMSKVDAQRIFQTKCRGYCDSIDTQKNLQAAAWLQGNGDPEFITACKTLGVEASNQFTDLAAGCLQACSKFSTSCDMPDEEALIPGSFQSRSDATSALSGAP